MDGNIEFLNTLYQTAKMGEDNIKTILKTVNAEEIKTDLQTQMNGYNTFSYRVQQEMTKHGTWLSPANTEARSRRSPATNS